MKNIVLGIPNTFNCISELLNYNNIYVQRADCSGIKGRGPPADTAYARTKRFLMYKHFLVRSSEAVAIYFRYVYYYSKQLFIEIEPVEDQELLN